MTLKTLHLVDRKQLPPGYGLGANEPGFEVDAVCGKTAVTQARRVLTNNYRAGKYKVNEGQELCPECVAIERQRVRPKR